jgi:hypothetical protein
MSAVLVNHRLLDGKYLSETGHKRPDVQLDEDELRLDEDGVRELLDYIVWLEEKVSECLSR